MTEVTRGGGADKAGMTKGLHHHRDQRKFRGQHGGLQGQLEYYRKGETVTLTIQIPQTNGEYEETTIDVTLK